MAQVDNMEMKLDTKLSDIFVEGEFPDQGAIDKLKSLTELDFPIVHFAVFIDEKDLSEWIIFGCGKLPHQDSPLFDIEPVKARMAKETGLLATDQVYTVKQGDPVKFDRVIPIPNLTIKGFIESRYSSNLLMRVNT